jgi:hypothetical protein
MRWVLLVIATAAFWHRADAVSEQPQPCGDASLAGTVARHEKSLARLERLVASLVGELDIVKRTCCAEGGHEDNRAAPAQLSRQLLTTDGASVRETRITSSSVETSTANVTDL